MFVTTKLRLRQSIGIVAEEGLVEFFKANIRSSLKLKMQSKDAINFLRNFNGINSITDISKIHPHIPLNQIIDLAKILLKNYILIEQNREYIDEMVDVDYRLVNMLEDYFHSSEDVINSIERIKNSRVMIIGLGAVGSFACLYLAKLGVKSFVLVDPDCVELSNLHRQTFIESDVGLQKTIQIKNKILEINSFANVETIQKSLQENFFEDEFISKNLDLIINCADEPSVDFTSRIVAKFSMRHKIPHIVGGGYNLHLTLVGQTIVPYETSCFKCFEIALDLLNGVELQNTKRLHRENRKLGSFSPISGIAASLASLDAFKILAGAEQFLQQKNRRVEFNVKNKKFNIIDIPRNPDCPWCGGAQE